MSILDHRGGAAREQPPGLFARNVRVARRYFLDLAPPRSTALAVTCGGFEECLPSYSVHRETFPHYVVEWVLRGRGRVRLGGRWREVGGGSLFAYGPDAAHGIEADAGDPMAKHFVCFTGTEALRLLTGAGLAPGTLVAAPKGADLPWLFESLWRDGTRGDVAAGELCASLLRYLLRKIAATPAGRRGVGARANYERCDAYVVEHAPELNSLADFAAACDVDCATLCRLYKRFAQQTPYGRLLRLKMHAIAERLMVDNRPFRIVAAESGYDDPFLLSRQFKRVFGVSPTEFRKLR